jgi:hypothetical protein
MFASVLVAQLLDRVDTHASFFKACDGYADVYDGLGYHAWDGCATHMLDIQYVLADDSLQEGLLLLEESFPFGSVWGKSDNASLQANHPVAFTLQAFKLRRLTTRASAARGVCNATPRHSKRRKTKTSNCKILDQAVGCMRLLSGLTSSEIESVKASVGGICQ